MATMAAPHALGMAATFIWGGALPSAWSFVALLMLLAAGSLLDDLMTWRERAHC